MMNRRSSAMRNSSTSCSLILHRSAATPNPIGPHSQVHVSRSDSAKYTKRTQSGIGNYDQYNNDGRKQEIAPQKKAQPVIEYYPFPQSPDLDDLLGIISSNHPQHRLVQVKQPSPFVCMGCKEYGAGTRFACQECKYELHEFCALSPPVLKAHPLHSQHQLVLHSKPAGKGLLRAACDVCGKAWKGYMFKCSACSFQLHPCCAMLSPKMTFPTHPHPLVILPVTANLAGDVACAECKRRRSGQVYRCTVCDYYLHAVCAKNMVNGLHVNGLKGLDKGPNRGLGVAAKIASQVVMGFMGGIFEGIGEGLGEALTQNIAKGRCASNNISTSSQLRN